MNMGSATQQSMAGQWKQMKGRITEKWGQLSDDDIDRTQGQYDQLVGLIQEKTGQAREEIEQFLQFAGQEVGQGEGDFWQQASQYGQQMAQRLRETYQQTNEQMRGYMAQTADTIRRNPERSVAVMFGVGLAAGVVLGLVMRAR